jgi:hypothetical protein
MSALKEASSHLAKALDHHDNKRPGSARRSIKAAQECVNRAIKEAPQDAPDAIANPTGATGAQTSNGQQSHAITAESMATRLFAPSHTRGVRK